jgi:hypothetical protein
MILTLTLVFKLTQPTTEELLNTTQVSEQVKEFKLKVIDHVQRIHHHNRAAPFSSKRK